MLGLCSDYFSRYGFPRVGISRRDLLYKNRVWIRAAVVGYQVMDSSRRGGIAQKLSLENIYQVAGHLVHGKLVPPYPPLHPSPTNLSAKCCLLVHPVPS